MLRLRRQKAILALEDGTVFEGESIGAPVVAVGEVVFNTSMTGYQEIITDPSYKNQLVTLTCPHIGNVGINQEDIESDKLHLAGLITKNIPYLTSNYRQSSDLRSYLISNGVAGIADIDTRLLTRKLRNDGSMNGCLMAGEVNERRALKLAKEFEGLNGVDLAIEVGSNRIYDWRQTEWSWQSGFGYRDGRPKYHVVAYDFGVKSNILRKLASRSCRVTVVPPRTNADEVLKLEPNGVFLSNGPGDPEPCLYAIKAIKKVLEKNIPLFGICLGHQLLALACGAQTEKMKFGHHGSNHPVKDLKTGRVVITSQNHGFCVRRNNMPKNLEITHVSLFDGSIQGLSVVGKPAFSFQGHPEASPGPHDTDYLFDSFFAMMN